MLLAAVLLQASAAPIFAPPLDAPLRVVTERIETGATARRFRMERLVRFAREDSGYRAEIVILTTSSDTPEPSGALYEAGFGSLAGHVLVFHLDAAGKPVGIDDIAGIWDRLCRGVAESIAARRALPQAERAALTQRIAAPIRAMPLDRQREMLGSLVTALIAEEAGEPAGAKPVRLPGALPSGPVTLEGQRILSPTPDAHMRSLTRAAADAPLPSEGSAPARIGRIEIEQQREFDPRTGLMAHGVDTTRTRLGDGADVRETRRVTTLEVTSVPSSAWPNTDR